MGLLTVSSTSRALNSIPLLLHFTVLLYSVTKHLSLHHTLMGAQNCIRRIHHNLIKV